MAERLLEDVGGCRVFESSPRATLHHLERLTQRPTFLRTEPPTEQERELGLAAYLQPLNRSNP